MASFLDAALGRLRTHAPEVSTSAGTLATAEFRRPCTQESPPPRATVVALQVPAERAGSTVVDELLVEAAHRRGVAVHVWTINERARWRDCSPRRRRDHSDRPPMPASWLRRRGVAGAEPSARRSNLTGPRVRRP